MKVRWLWSRCFIDCVGSCGFRLLAWWLDFDKSPQPADDLQRLSGVLVGEAAADRGLRVYWWRTPIRRLRYSSRGAGGEVRANNAGDLLGDLMDRELSGAAS
ncbi:hypothetical protein, partial [Phytohabitans aurantiacus]|uniref:hypothetical protein n=1 Tax=Phytohabitans aurantiacus TaxID=3016789 RepID=UPI002490A222